jgi:hypothetical protein
MFIEDYMNYCFCTNQNGLGASCGFLAPNGSKLEVFAEMPGGKFLWDATFEIAIRRLVDIDAVVRWEGIVEQLRGQEDEDGSESDDVDPDDLHTAAAMFNNGGNMGGDPDFEMKGAGDDAVAMHGASRAAVLLGTAEDSQVGETLHCTTRRNC